MIAIQKLQIRFLFYRKSFLSRDIQIFVNYSRPVHTFQIQKDKWKWNNPSRQLHIQSQQ